MKKSLFIVLILFPFVCFSQIRRDIPQVEVLNISSATNLFEITIYNNNDSILYLLSSPTAKYRMDSLNVLSPIKRSDKTLYDIDYTLADSRIDPFLPLKKMIVIMPYQQVKFLIQLQEKTNNQYLRISFFFKTDFSYSKTNKEIIKPAWFNKYLFRTKEVKINN